jgi:hypothetical protein
VEGVVVPGHGDPADRAFAEAQAAGLAGLAGLARRIAGGELTLEDAVAATPFPAYPPDDVRRPLERALAQLRGDFDPTRAGTTD